MTLQAKPKESTGTSDEFNKKGCIVYTQKDGNIGLVEVDESVRFSRDSDGEIRVSLKDNQLFLNTSLALITYIYMHIRFHGGVVDIQAASELSKDDPLYDSYLNKAEDPKVTKALLKRVKRLKANDFALA
jgi:hypothetical protein